MTRIIKASEVKLGMEIEWSKDGVLHRLTPNNIVTFKSNDSHKVTGYNFCAVGGGVQWVSAGQEITVLSETAPAQPAEPTEFGARVRVRDGRFVRLSDTDLRYHLWHEEGTGYQWAWDDLCEMGPVTVIPDQGWTAPETPEVPDRIEEWPENDEHLKDHKWRDERGDIWSFWSGKWGYQAYGWKWRPLMVLPRPFDGPWTRVVDA